MAHTRTQACLLHATTAPPSALKPDAHHTMVPCRIVDGERIGPGDCIVDEDGIIVAPNRLSVIQAQVGRAGGQGTAGL